MDSSPILEVFFDYAWPGSPPTKTSCAWWR